MMIDGRQLANELLVTLSGDVRLLKEQGIDPTLAVILIGDDPNSLSYIKQKQNAAEKIGVTLMLYRVSSIAYQEKLKELIIDANADRNVHGIIVQRPLPNSTGETLAILNSVDPKKDVDGFVPNSAFEPPVAIAVIKILEKIYSGFRVKPGMTFIEWIRTQNIVVLGRGETAGTPVAHALEKRQCTFTVVHSQTEHAQKITKLADILISCVGKKNVIKASDIKKDAILIGVGLGRDEGEKLRGDFDEKEIEAVASFYTPTPGGVGPVNVACLMQNVVMATQKLLI